MTKQKTASKKTINPRSGRSAAKKKSRWSISRLSKSRQMVLVAFILVFGIVGGVRLFRSFAATTYYGPGNTYVQYYFPANSGYKSLEWTIQPIEDPPASLRNAKLLHYYANTFYLNNSTSRLGFGYAGFQTNGIFNDTNRGKVINFSIWGSTAAKSSSPLINPNNSECGCHQIMFTYDYKQKHNYRFELKPGPSGQDAQNKWWGLYVTDVSAGTTTFVGEQRVARIINGKGSSLLKNTSVFFGEDLNRWQTVNGNIRYTGCQSFQKSSMVIKELSANGGSVKPNNYTSYTNAGEVNTGSNGFKTTNCPTTLVNGSNMNVQNSLGYWNPLPADYVSSTPSDTVDPSQTTGVKASKTETYAITLTWNPANDNVGVARYVIYRGNHQAGITTTNSFKDTGLQEATSYNYTVEARDAVGNVGVASPATKLTTASKKPPAN